MGDLVEITTWPNYSPDTLYTYKINSKVFTFEVMASGNATIRLARERGDTCDLTIKLGENQQSWIMSAEANADKKVAETPNILSPNEYRRFWIKCHGGVVRLGRDGDKHPILLYNYQIPDLKYFSFALTETRHSPVYWRFIVPPYLEKPKLKSITGGDLHWVDVDSERRFPDDALVAGHEKDILYIIRAQHRGSLTPGKFTSLEGLGYVPWGGDAHQKYSFQVLCGFDCKWVPTKRNNIPVGAIVAGHTEGRERENLYIGRANYNGHLIPGKVQPTHKVCYIPYDGKEIAQATYEILVDPNKVRPGMLLKFQTPTSREDTDDEDLDDDDDDDQDYDQYADYGAEYENFNMII